MTTKRWNREKSRAGERPEESEEHRCKKKPRVYIIIIISFKYQNRPRIKKKGPFSTRSVIIIIIIIHESIRCSSFPSLRRRYHQQTTS